MRGRRSVRLTACLAALGLATPASAAILEWTSAVPGHPGLTYFDLIKQVVRDLAKTDDGHAEGHLTRQPRHLAGRDYEGPPPDPVTVGYIEDKRIRIGGQRRIALLVDLGPDPERVQSEALLMLFTDAAEPKLLDVAGVSVDKDTGFADHAVLTLGPGDDALVSYSEHNDADLTFGNYMLISPVGDRLRLVQVYFTPSVVACGWSNIEATTFSTAPDAGSAYRQIDVKVRAVFKHTDPSCGPTEVPKARSTVFRATYHWNAKAHVFRTGSDMAERLKAFNDRIFK